MKSMIKTCIFSALFLVSGYAQLNVKIEKPLTAERFEEAKTVALQWMKSEPGNAETYFQAGRLYSKLNNADSAEIFFKKGIEVNPKYAYNYVGMIRVAIQRGDRSNIPDLIENAEDNTNKRKDARLHIELADAYLLDTLADNPILTYTDNAKKIDFRSARLYLILGDYYMAKYNYTKALENYKNAIVYDSSAAVAYMKCGYMYENVKNFSEAENYYYMAVAKDSAFAPVYERLAELFYINKSFTKAKEAFERYVFYSERSLQTDKRYATFLYRAKDYTNAIPTLKKVIEIEKDPKYLRLLAYCYNELKDSINTVKVMEEFFKYVKPSDLLYTDCTIYGHQLLKIGSDSLGIENLLAAYAMDTTKMELLKEVAGIYQKQKRWKDAIRIQELRFEKAGNTLLLADYFDLGLAYFADTAFQKSKEMFDTVVTRSPNFFPGYVWLSRAVTRIDTSSQRLMLKPVYDRMVALALDSTALIDSMKFKAEYFPKYKNDLVLAINYLGYYYIQQDQPEAAAKYYYRIQQIDPNDPNAKLFFEQQKKKKK